MWGKDVRVPRGLSSVATKRSDHWARVRTAMWTWQTRHTPDRMNTACPPLIMNCPCRLENWGLFPGLSLYSCHTGECFMKWHLHEKIGFASENWVKFGIWMMIVVDCLCIPNFMDVCVKLNGFYRLHVCYLRKAIKLNRSLSLSFAWKINIWNSKFLYKNLFLESRVHLNIKTMFSGIGFPLYR